MIYDINMIYDFFFFNCLPKPEEFREDCSHDAIDSEIDPDSWWGQLKWLYAGVMEDDCTRPNHHKIEEPNKTCKKKHM